MAAASFRSLRGIAVADRGALYLTDAGSATVRKVAGGVVTLAGLGLHHGAPVHVGPHGTGEAPHQPGEAL